MATFRHPIAIEPADIDHMGHVNNSVYLKWVQDAVVDYWRSVAPPDAVACCLDAASLRPVRLAREVIARFLPPPA